MGSSGTGGPQGFRIYCLGCLSCRYLTKSFWKVSVQNPLFSSFLITTDPGLRLSRMTATGNDRPQKFPLSFPRAVVGNLLWSLFPSCVTTDPRQKRSGMTTNGNRNNISRTTPRRLTFQDDGKKGERKNPGRFYPPGVIQLILFL